MNIDLLHGDCVKRLAQMEEASVGAVICDPPYGLEFMGAEWDTLWVSGAGTNKPGIGERKTEWVSFGMGTGFGGANASCSKCGGRARGNKLCSCTEPEWYVRGKRVDPQEIKMGYVRQMQAWHEAWLKQTYRVLQPGGFIKAFGGARTFHRLMVAMATVGFEDLRLEAWTYGSGFPKSLNVGKQIDKQAGRVGVSVVKLKRRLIELFDASGKTRKQIDDECGFRACNYLTLPAQGKRFDPWVGILPTPEKWEKIKEVLGCDAAIQAELDSFFAAAEREIVGQQTKARSKDSKIALPTLGAETVYETWDVTTAASDPAKIWEGYGTALKPAWEPVVCGRKP